MRQAVQAQAQPRAQRKSYPAPVRGLVLAQTPADPVPQSCEALRNWIPTQRGIRMRGGLQAKATTGGNAVVSLFTYSHPTLGAIFASTTAAIYDISALDNTAQVAEIADQTAGYYSTAQIGTVGGNFLYAVNGADLALIFDGSNWNPVNGATVYQVAYDAKSADFTKGETLTGGTSGATAEILAVIPATSTTGVLKLGTITGGPFADNEALTDSATGAAVANGASASASTTAITGVTTSGLSAVWLYANRLFFVEKNTLSAWYLPVDSIGGAAAEVSLAGVFQKGGSLLFGATWSLDSGAGLDDKCVFVSTEGEIAIYTGTDPSSSTTWSIEGRYDIAEPMGLNGFMQAGGDLLIITVDGIVPLSEAIRKDAAALSLSAITRPIEPLWKQISTVATSPIEMIKWPARGIAYITLPEETEVLTINLNTGAWARQSGWTATCGVEFDGYGYIGMTDGTIARIDEGGFDIDQPYTCQACLVFDDFGDPTTFKDAGLMRAAYFAPTEITLGLSCASDYNADFPTAPDAASFAADSDYLIWDSGLWDVGLWWSDSVTEATTAFTTQWSSVSAAGSALACQIQVTSGQTTKPNVELLRLDLTYQGGGLAV